MRWTWLFAAALALAVGIPAMSKKRDTQSAIVSQPIAGSVPMGQGYVIQPLPIRPLPASEWSTPCTDDCSGHDAGHQWAEDNDIDDEDDCTGNSQSFIDGCVQSVQERSGNDEQ